MNSKKLNVEWVSDTIGEDYKKWKFGDVININAMTGTGKTYFIIDVLLSKRVEAWEKLIYICNRIELKRQIKIDILKKYKMKAKYYIDDKEFFDDKWINNNEIVFDFEWLDEITELRNVTIKSYHQIASIRLHRIFDDKNYYYLNQFEYIVCDECQFYLTDSNFNQYTYFAFDELVAIRNEQAITINLSATMEEVEVLIENQINEWKPFCEFDFYKNFKYYKYSTGIDYSYLDTKYFKKLDTIVSQIQKSKEKWLIFVSGMNQGENLKKQLNEIGIDVEFIKAGEESEEKQNITTKSTFNCRVLIATKCIDNGVNIKDKTIKNIVVMAWDKVTFIQMLGRLRLNIKKAHQVELYIRCASKKSFQNLQNGNLGTGYKEKFDDIELFKTDKIEFQKKYNNNCAKVPQDLFYLDSSNEWCINKLGLKRLELDDAFAEKMIKEFEVDKEFAFIKEQLSWLMLENTFDKNNLIDEELDVLNVKDLEMLLEDSYENEIKHSKEFFVEAVTEIIANDENLNVLFNKISCNGNRNKGQKAFNELFKQLFEKKFISNRFIVSSQTRKETINKKRVTKTYWVITKEED